MKKWKNKFIIFILILIAFISVFWIYKSYFYKIDRNTYAVLIQWIWNINNNSLILNKKEVLKQWDLVESVWDLSFIVIEWWDWSVTRLWPNSSIKIDELYVEEKLLKINLSFELLSWKTWSNIINFYWKDSYFKESFRDLEAWVRWTVFNVDLDNDYISVIKHKVELNWENLKLEIEENKPFSLKTLSFIKLEEFIKNIRDINFEQFNNVLDEQFLNWLREEIYKNLDKYVLPSLENIKNFSPEKREKLYNDLLSKYQDLNFLSPKDWELFTKKIEIKEKLINLSSWEEKQNLIESTILDFKDSLNEGNYVNLDKIFAILSNNSSILENLKIDLSWIFDNIKINDNLKIILSNNLNNLKNIFWSDFNKSFQKIWLEDLKNNTKDLYEKLKIKEEIQEQVWFFKKFLQFLFGN